MYLRSLLLLSSVVTLEQALPQNSADKRPSFGDYQVKPTFHGRPADPVLNTEFSNRFRTHIRDAAARGPNFAGHYVLADWGCGSACIQVAVIDAESGAVYEGPFRTLIYDIPARYADGADPNVIGFKPLVYRLDSRLLVVHGCPDQSTECRLYYYEWIHDRFRLLMSVRARLEPPTQ